jgi:hypothetical protein
MKPPKAKAISTINIQPFFRIVPINAILFNYLIINLLREKCVAF